MTVCEKRHPMAIECVLLKSGDEVEIEYCSSCGEFIVNAFGHEVYYP